jgi:hypothetical protein
MPNRPGWSKRTSCFDCGKPTAHTHRCDSCRRAYEEKRAKRRAQWAEEGRCITCSRIVLEENPKTGDLYTNCKVCRRRRSLKSMGFTTEEINVRLQKIGGRPPMPNAAPKKEAADV